MIGREALNEIVGLPTDGSALPHVLVTGPAFFSFPRLSPDGKKLAWTNWGHPRMPWDGTELWLAEMGAGAQLRGRRVPSFQRDERDHALAFDFIRSSDHSRFGARRMADPRDEATPANIKSE